MTIEDVPLAHIGEVAERTGLSHRTIRYYEEMGLVVPSARTEGGFRLYSEADVERLQLITPMKPLGFSIDEIRELLDALDTLAATKVPDGAGTGASAGAAADAQAAVGTSVEEQAAAREVVAAAREVVAAAHERAVPTMERLRATARRAEELTQRLAAEVAD
ncbi:MerR HTH family regulatory protein [Kytococcus aerolatus]|uniref:MerR HTH family regulatory protein n=1 Tax=Kytococcus aerolatus TaxID=592308 RepID=A0A212U5N2_9MICO|nr:MerR family transcriptional regulator [Kytococcus aerolatus]SNC73394.1 MerR HTH family regulatory protein [Kytococcus aerolatus]